MLVFRAIGERAHHVVGGIDLHYRAQLDFIENFARLAVRQRPDGGGRRKGLDFAVLDYVIGSFAAVGQRDEDRVRSGRYLQRVSQADIV